MHSPPQLTPATSAPPRPDVSLRESIRPAPPAVGFGARYRLRPPLLLAAGCLAATIASAEPAAVSIVDGVGRTLRVPASIERVYATSPVGAVMLYTLSPQKMVGWNYKLGQAERHFILPAARELPALGGWFGESAMGNRESILVARPDVILSVGQHDRTAIEFAERLQGQIGIPVFVASGGLSDTAATYELVGKLLGVPERAAALADYARRTLSQARAAAEAIPRREQVRVYYAEGMRGLQTDTRGSWHTELLDLLGVENVADVPTTSGFGRVSVSLDQVIAWKPDVVLACPEKLNANGSWMPEWLQDPAWREVPGVARGRVYLIPGAPFNWFDRPPSPARLLGLKWLLWVLYPERADFDMVAETREFYRLFYGYDLGEAEARSILEASQPKFVAKP
ncbi:ABC transporter substrate-binding protein [Opitutaceae bacterium EW11]|nr:ABC transporter substrate-binding protein [Opitutaceae bacterium EW11]